MFPERKNILWSVIALLSGFIVVYLAVHWQYGVFTQPYFWDELGVYSRSSAHLFYHGLSILPSSIPDELSRGHPLGCPFYFALAFKVFGCTPVTAHFAAAALNILGFYFCFRILCRYMPTWYAVAATLAIFVQPLFLSQSLLILPEMPLMVATLGAIMFYMYDRTWAACIALVIALQMKESALILPLAFILADVVLKRKLSAKTLSQYLLIPVASFVLFICVQKYQRGYFFYPLHTSLSSFDMYYIRERWDGFKHYFLNEQGQFVTWMIFCLSALVFIVRHLRNPKPLLHNKALILPVIIAGSLCFLVVNYYLSRYTMYFLVLYYILVFLLLASAFRRYIYFQLLLMGIILITGIYHWNNGKVYTDVDFSYSDHVKSLQLVIAEMDHPGYKDKNIGMDFPLSAAYWNSDNGYKTNVDVHSLPMQDSLPQKDFMVFTYPGNMADTLKYNDKMEFRKEVRSGYAYARIYQLKSNR